MNQLGTETAFEVLARANALASQGRDIINLGIGQPDFQTPDNIVEAGRKALADGHHGYTPAGGIKELRDAVGADVGGKILTEYKIIGFPTTVFLNGKHEIVHMWSGILTTEKLDELMTDVLN